MGERHLSRRPAGEEDVTTGAIRYSPSDSVHPRGLDPAVTMHPFVGPRRRGRSGAGWSNSSARPGRETPARSRILVRARSHLAAILPALRDAGMRFRAVESIHWRMSRSSRTSPRSPALAAPGGPHRVARGSARPVVRHEPRRVERAHRPATTAPHRVGVDARPRAENHLGRARPGATGTPAQRAGDCLRNAARLRCGSGSKACGWRWAVPACCRDPNRLDNAEAFFDLLEEMDDAGVSTWPRSKSVFRVSTHIPIRWPTIRFR